MYKVIGQHKRLNEQWDTHTSEFDTYVEAVDYYTSIMSGVIFEVVDYGGEFITTLVGNKGVGDQVIKRHVLSTTIV